MEVQENISLQSYNTFGLDASAQYFCEITNVEDLQQLIEDSKAKALPVLVLGGGSNILLTQDYKGLVLKINLEGQTILKEDDNHIWLRVGAGENWHSFVLDCVDKGYAGIENLSLIPGTVGAAPMQNIGAYGVEIEQVFDSLTAFEIETLKLRSFSKQDCEFGYRSSIFKTSAKGKYIITDVTLRLDKKPKINTAYGAIHETLEGKGIKCPTIRDVSNVIIGIRKSKLPDPDEIGNAGSFFKNPTIDKIDYEGLKFEFNNIPGYELPDDKIKIPAGWLIEHCGWKGKVIGNTGAHKDQALVLVNYGNASGLEVFQLAKEIKQSVVSKFGIELEMEVNVI